MATNAQDRFLTSRVLNNYREIFPSFKKALSSQRPYKAAQNHVGKCDGCYGALYRLSLDELVSFNPESYISVIQPIVPFTHRNSVHRHKALGRSDSGEHGKGNRDFEAGESTREYYSGSYDDNGDDNTTQYGYGQDDSGVQERYRYVLPKEPDEEDRPLESLNYNSYESWSGTFEWTEQVHKLNREVFGNASFRPNQLEVINCILSGRDTFVVIPTGGGKSLCFQLPAVYDGINGNKGVTVVVMPLVALIQDQMKRLTALNIPCHALIGDLSWADRKSIFGDISDDNYKSCILFVTPEGIATSKALLKAFKNLEQQGRLSRFIVDEAHCVSVWGDDFRPDYKEMGLLKHEFPNVPVCAFTATATEKVINDVSRELRLRSPTIFKSSFNRPNLRYEVIEKDRNTDKAIEQLIQLVSTRFRGSCGIIYCLSCAEVEKVAELLGKHIPVAPYHAQMQMNMRNTYYKAWISGRVDIMVATIAFGMGIDKGDVRFVVHFSMPKSIENYFQESGRAGRDGKEAVCIICYAFHDYQRLLLLVNRSSSTMKESSTVDTRNILSVLEYCQSSFLCRRKFLLSYFGENFEKKCDVPCDSCSCSQTLRFFSRNCQQEALFICECMMYFKKNAMKPTINFTLVNLHKTLMGKTPIAHNLSGYLSSKGFTSDMAMLLLKYMVIYQLLVERAVPVAGKNFTSFYIGVNQQYRSHVHNMATLKFPTESAPKPRVEKKPYIKETKKPATTAKKVTKGATKAKATAKAPAAKKEPKKRQPSKKAVGKKEPLIKNTTTKVTKRNKSEAHYDIAALSTQK